MQMMLVITYKEERTSQTKPVLLLLKHCCCWCNLWKKLSFCSVNTLFKEEMKSPFLGTLLRTKKYLISIILYKYITGSFSVRSFERTSSILFFLLHRLIIQISSTTGIIFFLSQLLFIFNCSIRWFLKVWTFFREIATWCSDCLERMHFKLRASEKSGKCRAEASVLS